MVEGERGDLTDRKPSGLGRIGGTLGRVLIRPDQGIVGNADDMSARIASGGAEGLKLLHEDSGEVGFLRKFATRGGFDVLVLMHKASGECPLVFERLDSPPDQQDFKIAAIESEDHAIDREGRAGELIGVGHGGYLVWKIHEVKR